MEKIGSEEVESRVESCSKIMGEEPIYILAAISDMELPMLCMCGNFTGHNKAQIIKGLMSKTGDKEMDKMNKLVLLDVMQWCTEQVQDDISKKTKRN